MTKGKYITTKEAVRLTGLSSQEIYELIHSGKLPAHKAPKSGWRILPEDLAALGLVKDDGSPAPEESETADHASYIADEEHFSKVFKLMTQVKHSLKIATANIKIFNVSVEKDGEYESVRIYDFFLSLVKRGVHVQMVCMDPFNFYQNSQKKCQELLENPLFELRCNEHNHMKIFIFDDECAYIGSANITEAAIGRRASGKRNHEAGMLVWGPGIMEMPLRHFDRAWNDPCILKHTWKRFATKAKEKEKKRKELYGK